MRNRKPQEVTVKLKRSFHVLDVKGDPREARLWIGVLFHIADDTCERTATQRGGPTQLWGTGLSGTLGFDLQNDSTLATTTGFAILYLYKEQLCSMHESRR